MRLEMLTRRSDFIAAKGRSIRGRTPRSKPDAKIIGKNNPSDNSSSRPAETAAWGTASFLLQARLRPVSFQAENMNISGPRFGITVSKHTIRRGLLERQEPKKGGSPQKRGPIGVMRNRMRRRLREALLLIAPLAARDGIDYVLIGRSAALTLPFEILLKDLEKSFQKVHRRIIPSGSKQIGCTPNLLGKAQS